MSTIAQKRLTIHKYGGFKTDDSNTTKQLAKLRHNEHRLRQIIDLMPNYIYANDEEGRIILANKALAELYQRNIEDLEGEYLLNVTQHREQSERFLEINQQVMQSGKPVHIKHMPVLDTSGEPRIIEFYCIPFTDIDTGRPTVFGIATDITEQIENEDALLEKLNQDKELQVARQIQQQLMPEHDPDLNNFDIAGWSLAANQTGGDYYDWLVLPDGKLLFNIADVTGHGVGSAIIASICRSYFRALAQGGLTLKAIVENINRMIMPDLTDGKIITAAMGILDPEECMLNFFSAGHGSVFYFSAANKQIEQWQAHDIPIGVATDMQAEPTCGYRFEKGDILAIVTDGFFEWENHHSEQYGTERLCRIITDYHELHPKKLIQQLYVRVQEHGNGISQSDDLTALIIKCENN